MTISKDVFLAQLAMDAYNRGYGAGVADGTGPTDANGFDADGLGGTASTLGSIAVLDIDLPDGAQAAGFYAVSYQVTDGSAIDGYETGDIIISFRGTDNNSLFSDSVSGGGDRFYGWGLGAGSYDATQAGLAVEFYKSVVASQLSKSVSDLTLSDLADADITLTGHSMGGGLAGFVAGRELASMTCH
ncbi:MAG: hypothetical protein AAF940_00085 [Pseudomonadota bacterium]